MPLFFIIFLAMLAALTILPLRAALRYLRQFFPNLKAWPVTVIWVLLTLLFPASIVLPYGTLGMVCHFVGGIWVCILIYSFLILLLWYLIRAVIRLAGKKEFSRRQKITIGSVISALSVMIVLAGVLMNTQTVVKNYTLQIDKDGIDDLRVVMVSDLHLSYSFGAGRTEKMKDRINALEPDVVLIVGDIFDSGIESVAEPDKVAQALSRIESDVYLVLGNHDGSPDNPETLAFAEAAGLNLLSDKAALVDNRFWIVGRSDRRVIGFDDTERPALSKLMEGIDRDMPIIVMDHQPYSIEETREQGADLLLSGHTHRGQIWPGSIITRFMYDVDYGLLESGQLTTIVTSGIGTWGPAVRTTGPSEIVCIDINA